MFFQNRWIGGWQTRQRRSYFALKLPHSWWLWGVDLQLESDIDQPQLDYFCEVAKERVNPGDRIILATAEPDWIYGNIYDLKLQNNLAFLEERVLRDAKATLRVALAGDLHHYRRHQAADGSGKQLITAGGGGAFRGDVPERAAAGAGHGAAEGARFRSLPAPAGAGERRRAVPGTGGARGPGILGIGP